MNINFTYFKAVCWKETKEILQTLKISFVSTIICSNLLLYVTDSNVMSDKNLQLNVKSTQLGALTMYVPLLVILFLGHTLITKFINEERKNKTIMVLLASGINQTVIWYAQLVVTMLCSIIAFLITIITHIIFIKFYFGVLIKFTPLTAVITFIAMPILTIGMLAIISICYWYFNNVGIFSTIFPIVAYLGIWNLSLHLHNKFPSALIAICSLIVGAILIIVSSFFISKISKGRVSKIE